MLANICSGACMAHSCTSSRTTTTFLSGMLSAIWLRGCVLHNIFYYIRGFLFSVANIFTSLLLDLSVLEPEAQPDGNEHYGTDKFVSLD
ncbi:hypothetical protein BDR04DRAFT_379656 [Suillus decipiens]|nr:hypothetical protein BDR04DRAFT_379656 [Suillus decipiens]